MSGRGRVSLLIILSGVHRNKAWRIVMHMAETLTVFRKPTLSAGKPEISAGNAAGVYANTRVPTARCPQKRDSKWRQRVLNIKYAFSKSDRVLSERDKNPLTQGRVATLNRDGWGSSSKYAVVGRSQGAADRYAVLHDVAGNVSEITAH
ncbi:hypothetical protein J6590_018084 [Homalodisca vitripennis]|nr:hypothetical protein J6590_018084 [Homalodisca vitripennis]